MTSFDIGPAATLAAEVEAIIGLTALLEQEQEQLIAANIEQITSLTEPKAEATVNLTKLAAKRYQALRIAGHTASESGMQTWLATSDASQEARAAWNNLIAHAENAKELNRINGTLINKQMVRNQALLGILQHGSVQGSQIYGPTGQTASKSIGRHIIA